MVATKILGLGIALVAGLLTLDVAGPPAFGAGCNAACQAAKHKPTAHVSTQTTSSAPSRRFGQQQVGGAPRNTFSRRPASPGTAAGTAASSEKVSPRQAAEEA